MTHTTVLTLGVCGALAAIVHAASPSDSKDGWSDVANGLQARISLVERPKSNGTRQLVPYLELRNVRDSAAPLKVRCSGENVKFDLVGKDGKRLREGYLLPRSGPHADPGMVVLPFDSSIRIGMYCSNWGVPKDAAAMISTDSGAWVLDAAERGKVFLRATLKGSKLDADPYETWHGEIVAPLVPVDWKGS